VERRGGRVPVCLAAALATAASLCAFAGTAAAAAPAGGTVKLDSSGHGSVAWHGTVGSTPATLGSTTDACFGADRKPDPTAGCDFFSLTVDAPESIVRRFFGTIDVAIKGFGSNDLDLSVYVKNPNGTKGYQLADADNPAAGGNGAGQPELFPIENPTGPAHTYYVVIVPYTAPPATAYTGSATFNLKALPLSLTALNARFGPGPPNYRASHDKYISHSEPSIAMDPTNHNHLIAGSKMYEALSRYLFKAGTYESFDGGRHWSDLGQLPGYCQSPGQCDPNDEERYRTVSDIATAFDDEGNGYANVLDAPGGTFAFTGFNMTVHIKKPGKPWTGPITVHDNQTNPITQQALLDDKNWIAVDNSTDVNGGPNRPHDGKIGTLYVCWSLDASINPIPIQQIVLERSTDGGHTWGGVAPGDNTPLQLSQKGEVSGVGCHVAVGPQGEVYVTWYDNQLDALMQVKSTDRGHTFTPARPIATITGVNDPFAGEQFRNLSIPSSAVDSKGNVYVVVSSQDADGAPVVGGAIDRTNPKHPTDVGKGSEQEATGGADTPGGSDIVLFKSSDGGVTYTGPVRVNQDKPGSDADQFQPWIAVTPKGQVDISYFDRRNDPKDLFIDTYLSRSNDGGKTFFDTRVTHQLWDPRVNPPTSASGEFIGDYQGLVADDNAAIPFWNDTQAANLSPNASGYSPWQEVYAARIPNGASLGGPGACKDKTAPKSTLKKSGVKNGSKGLSVSGSSSDRGCGKGATAKGHLKKVYVSVAKVKGKDCSFMDAKGHFTAKRNCRRPILLSAKGTSHWRYSTKTKLKSGTYRMIARGVDAAGNKEKPNSKRNSVTIKIR
jgi:hypothetical protein